jgi:hypothetical protein
VAVTVRPPPDRHWRSNGTDPLPTPQEAMQQPMRAFPSWFLKVTCDRCGKDRMLNESHMTDHQRRMVLRVLLNRLRHEVLRRRGGQGRAADRHRRRLQPAGAADRADRRLTV